MLQSGIKRRMKYLINLFALFFAVFPSEQALDAAEIRPWTLEATMQTKGVRDVQISPDNESALFVVSEYKLTNEKWIYLSRIYKSSIKTGVATPFLETDSSAMQPRWSPDGKWIAFVSSRAGSKNLYLVSSNGGEVTSLTQSKKDIQSFSWSPDGTKIAFVMEDKKKNSEEKVNRLWLLNVFSSHPIPSPITTDDYCVRGTGDHGSPTLQFDWSLDSCKILFAYSPRIGWGDFRSSSIACVHLLDGTILPWEKKARYEALPRYSPDGKFVAYICDDSSDSFNHNRRVSIRLANGENPQLLARTFNEGTLSFEPNFLGWDKEGRNVFFCEPHRTKLCLSVLPMDGGPVKQLETHGTFFRDPVLNCDRTMLGLVIQSPSTPPEAFISHLDSFEPKQISSLNNALLSYPEIKTRIVSWESKDGSTIEGLLTYPVDYKENKRYPLLVQIHGGPYSAFYEYFLGAPQAYPIASFAQEGFFIFRPNPRGSTGYGKNFRRANYKDFGGGDFIDIMTGIDALIAKGFVDEQKIGVMGWSYGGYLTAWAITQTARFKAASVGAGIFDFVSFGGNAQNLWLTEYLGAFTENSTLYEERSPSTYVLNVSSPCLIIHGDQDEDVPVAQSYALYNALQESGLDAEFLLVPGMGHSPSDPDRLFSIMQKNLSWFEHHLKNTP